MPDPVASLQLGRNAPCRCGSGKKYKKCCMAKDEAAAHEALEKQWTQAAQSAKRVKKGTQKSSDSPASASKPSGIPPGPASRRNIFVIPKFNMSRRSGGG